MSKTKHQLVYCPLCEKSHKVEYSDCDYSEDDTSEIFVICPVCNLEGSFYTLQEKEPMIKFLLPTILSNKKFLELRKKFHSC